MAQLKEEMDTDTVNEEWDDDAGNDWDAEVDENEDVKDNDPADEENDDQWGGNDDDFNDDDFEQGDDDWGDTEVVEPGDIIDTSNNPMMPLVKQASVVTSVSPEDIDKCVAKKVEQLAEELNLSEKQCLLLLRRYKWNSAKINEVYFLEPEKILVGAGVCIKPADPAKIKKIQSKKTTMECEICMDDVAMKDTFTLECGHLNTCKNCWVDYLRNKVQTKSCVTLTCPTSKCYVTIPEDVWQCFLCDKYPQELARYTRFCRENFVENSKEFCYCPGKNCEMIYSSESGVAKEIACNGCGHRFCWACKNDSHFPSSCHTGGQWLAKCSSEAENISWILAKTKRCPKCHVHIEKNQGCNHMTCRKHAGGCGHEFCWLCKGDWSKHGSSTGGYYKCNIFEKNQAEGKLDDEQQAQANAQNELERYEFHYTRFDSHSKSSRHAIKQKETTHERMHNLAKKFQWRLNEAQFLMDAVNEAIQCWHTLAWTYPVAYYLDEKQFGKDKIILFKEQQGMLENFCNGIQEKLDFDMEKLGDIKIRQTMISYTRTAQKYRKNLVDYIETEVSF